MKKRHILSIVFGVLLWNINTGITIATREDWLTSNWLSRSNGVIAILFIWPPVFLWAWRSREKHKALSYFVMAYALLFSVIVCCFILFVH